MNPCQPDPSAGRDRPDPHPPASPRGSHPSSARPPAASGGCPLGHLGPTAAPGGRRPRTWPRQRRARGIPSRCRPRGQCSRGSTGVAEQDRRVAGFVKRGHDARRLTPHEATPSAAPWRSIAIPNRQARRPSGASARVRAAGPRVGHRRSDARPATPDRAALGCFPESVTHRGGMAE